MTTQILIAIGMLLTGYLLGSIPSGYIWVKLISGKDVRGVASGRTGGTNAARAAGAVAGLLTALFDGLKALLAVGISQWVTAAAGIESWHWLHAATGLVAILGHNYSIFLAERTADGRIRLRGGAGGAPAVGAGVGLWPPSVLIVVPVGVLVFFGIGYASLTTLSAAATLTVIFGVLYAMHQGSGWDIAYGVVAMGLLAWALRPNIKALREGTERFHGWRPWKKKGIDWSGQKHD